MTDDALRAAERAFAADRTHETEVALIRARLRSGALTQARVWLAAWLGHHAAEVALGEEAPPRRGPVAVGPAVERLEQAGRRALLRVAVDALAQGRARRPWPRGTFAALRAWCTDGTPLPAAVAAVSRQLPAHEDDALALLVRLARTGRGWVAFVEGLRAPPNRAASSHALLDLPPPPPPPPGFPRSA